MEDIIESLEKDLAEAVARQDAIKYVKACDELGISPGDLPELYDRGQADIIYLRNLGDQARRKNKDFKYKSFYREGERLSTSFGEDVISKRKLLENYFPRRFGKNGKQPIQKMEDLQAGSVFKKMLDYSERRIS